MVPRSKKHMTVSRQRFALLEGSSILGFKVSGCRV